MLNRILPFTGEITLLLAAVILLGSDFLLRPQSARPEVSSTIPATGDVRLPASVVHSSGPQLSVSGVTAVSPENPGLALSASVPAPIAVNSALSIPRSLARTAPASRPSRRAPPVFLSDNQPLPRPAAFTLTDLSDRLSPEQQARTDEIIDRFLATVGDLDPARPEEFKNRWRAAVSESDRLFTLYFGSFAFIQYNLEANRQPAGS